MEKQGCGIFMLLIALGIILVSNFFTPIRIGLGTVAFCNFSSSNGAFTYYRSPGEGVGFVDSFKVYKQKHPELKDTVLYRIDKRRIECFWNWYNYLTAPYWTDYPYISREQIDANRKKEGLPPLSEDWSK